MNPLYGLVVCGGKSTRMGMDKSMINYHGQPQRYHLYDMLLPMCDQVFISCNAEQANTIPDKYAVIVDAAPYVNIGPMAALLNAFRKYPDANFLVVGCDYPLVSISHLENLIKVSLKANNTAASYNILECIYEPLISVYQCNISVHLEEKFKQNKFSLREVLEEVNASIVIPEKNMQILSIDNKEEMETIMNQLRSV